MIVPQPGFTGSLLDRADALRLDDGRIAELAAHADARLLLLDGHDPVLGADGRLVWTELDKADPDAALIFLGLDRDAPRFAALVPVVTGGNAGPLFRVLSAMHPADAACWAAARSLIEWHSRHGFCANCGAATTVFRAGWGRRCEACAAEHFPRVDPVVIMLAQYEGRVLLGRQPRFPAGRYSALAGFVEPGESIEEAVAREIFEEAGLTVANVRYVASQPWPFPGSLMIACIADAADDAVTLDSNELEDSIWADRGMVRAALNRDPAAAFVAPPDFAIANTLLRVWAEGAEPLAGQALPA